MALLQKWRVSVILLFGLAKDSIQHCNLPQTLQAPLNLMFHKNLAWSLNQLQSHFKAEAFLITQEMAWSSIYKCGICLPLKSTAATKWCSLSLIIRDANFNNLFFILKRIFWISQAPIFPEAQLSSLYFLRPFHLTSPLLPETQFYFKLLAMLWSLGSISMISPMY